RPTVKYPDPKRLPYHMKAGQLVPQMAPFGKGQRYNITGLIHDESGFPTNSTEEARKMMERLMHKISDNYDYIKDLATENMDDADIAIFCYGGTARAAKSAMDEARAKGLKVGIFRPRTIWPFPENELAEASRKLKKIVVAEHNFGQMLLEVQRVVKNNCPVSFVGKWNGGVITPSEILAKIEEA
ncbi:MAG: hypothetical protein II544_00855, partial [Spirochaetales bacterium]|nr:hypothetical protein [Spirochaetales bacterium]